MPSDWHAVALSWKAFKLGPIRRKADTNDGYLEAHPLALQGLIAPIRLARMLVVAASFYASPSGWTLQCHRIIPLLQAPLYNYTSEPRSCEVGTVQLP